MKKRFAFTLAEVLITLGVIGIVAALTLPGIINKSKAKRLKSQYQKAYSEIAQGIKMMKYDDVSLDTSNYQYSQTFKNTYISYFKVLDACLDSNNNPLCADTSGKNYKTLDGSRNMPGYWIDDGQFVLLDGTLLMFENPSGSTTSKVWIHADINGKKGKPNKWGYDVFTFCILNEELVPMGARGTEYTNMTSYCNPKGSGQFNGIACAYQAMNESDYFDKIVQSVK